MTDTNKKGSTFRRSQKDKNNPYVIINKKVLNDERLSFKAKGLMALLLSFPDDWQIYESDLAKRSADGRTSVNSGIKELIEKGYIKREVRRNDKGHFKGYDYIVYETPIQKDTESRKPDFGKPDFSKSDFGKPATTNNNSNNNNDTNNNDIYIYSIFETWLNANIIKHQRLTSTMKRKVRNALKEYTAEEIKTSIKNYGYILNDDNYFFNYKWGLDQFCTLTEKDRIAMFIDLDIAKQNYLDKRKVPNQPTEKEEKPKEESKEEVDLKEYYSQFM